MNIGIIIGRIGGVDGVALETEKWVEVLHRMGHTIHILSGIFEERFQKGHAEIARLVPPSQRTVDARLYFFHDDVEQEQALCFSEHLGEEEEAVSILESNVRSLKNTICSWLDTVKPDLVISQNASALPMHLSLGVAIHEVFSDRPIPVITHDHDFWWERGTKYKSPYSTIQTRLEKAFPLRLEHSVHAVINTAAHDHLEKHYQRASIIVPNVMDFSVPFGHMHSENSNFKKDLGYDENDVLLLQITRVVRRKGIETALELVDRLDDPRVKLLISGSHTDDPAGAYYLELCDEIGKRNIRDQVHFVPDRVQNKAYTQADGTRVYSLSDAYAYGTAACYFSTYEGFGNAFVECIAARKPIFVNNYKPVYWSEIGSKGFQTVQVEDSVLTDDALADIESIIHDRKRQHEIAAHNFELGKTHFSYEVLQDKLEEILASLHLT